MSSGPLEKDTCRDYVLPKLKAAGWSDEQIIEQFPITDGRIMKVGSKHRRDDGLRADYVLEVRPGVPIAVVEAKRSYSIPAKGMQQAKRYAQMLDLSFAYSTNGQGIVEDDRDTGRETENLLVFPSPDELWKRYRAWKGIESEPVAAALTLPFNRSLRTHDGGVKEPRYYQRIAISRAIEGIVRGDKRLLLTMATGTGKTFVALQIIWKLWSGAWRTDRKPRVLYLADRNILIDQPLEREFRPVFGSGDNTPLWKLGSEAKAGREIYFGLYQRLSAGDGGIYRQFAPDFFDLVIVDECHRGSASAESEWRAILEHFSPAAQLGMTATPKRDDDVDTYEWFGEPIYTYSLKEGINDGFLAPYRVHRVVLSPDAHGWAAEKGQLDMFGKDIPEGLYTTRHFERVVSLLSRTEAAARHLTEFLRRTDRMAKTIVFCVDQEHADQMRRALHNANSDKTTQHPNYVVRIVSDEGGIGMGHLSDLADVTKEVPVIATTSQLLSTGVDLPTVRNIVLFRPIGSMAMFKQMIGRGTRLFPDDDKLSFDIIDYCGATALFEDPEFDGPAERVEEEAIDEEGNVVAELEVAEPEPELAGDDDDGSGDVEPEDVQPRQKFYVDQGEFWVTAEGIYQLDPLANRLRLVEYRGHVIDTVRALYPDPAELRRLWAKSDGRVAVVDALAKRGIDPAELGQRTGLVESDPIDLLVHLAWNQPLATRADRVRRVRKEHADFFERFRPEARLILNELLTKYAVHGVDQVDDLSVLLVPPIAQLGSPAELAGRFDGAEQLQAVVRELRDRLYAA